MTRRQLNINRFFRPSAEITADNAALFAGRKNFLIDGLKAFDREDGSVAIFGERGVGKSSLGRILMGLLGRRIAPKALGLPLNTRNPVATCVWQSWDAGMETVPDLLLEILNPNTNDEYSLAVQYPELVESYADEFQDIKEKLEAAEDNGVMSSIRTQRKKAYRLFRQVESEIVRLTATDPTRRLVIFIDEVERVGTFSKKNDGLGSFIKDSKINFCIIGIGATFSEILQDHKSAERKFYDAQFEVKTLTQAEVHELFSRANMEAAKQDVLLNFTDEFCDCVFVDFGGYPNKIQQFGYEVADVNIDKLEAGQKVNVDGRDYQQLLRNREQRASMVKMASDLVDESLGSSNSRWDMLCTMAKLRNQNTSAKWVNVNLLRQEVPDGVLRKFDGHLKRFIDRKILFTLGDKNAVQFASTDILIEVNRRIRIGWKPKEV